MFISIEFSFAVVSWVSEKTTFPTKEISSIWTFSLRFSDNLSVNAPCDGFGYTFMPPSETSSIPAEHS